MFLKWIRLIRVGQWYKNLLIFAALFFSGTLLNIDLLWLCVLGFVGLCLTSSSGYILNDILDRKIDSDNKKKPIAQGEISIFVAVVVSILFLTVGAVLLYSLSFKVLLVGLILFLSTVFYSIIFKKMVFLDIILIAVNFVLRALAGVFLLDVRLSSWFLTVIFFTALYLVSGKRIAELVQKTKKSISQHYTKKILEGMTYIFLSIDLVLYVLYSYFEGKLFLIYLSPILLYMFLIIQSHIHQGDNYIRHFESMFKDKRFLIASIIYLLLVFAGFYL
ncbi:UbiA prenyltransferase family protein [Nanoarchaeota archaeon]